MEKLKGYPLMLSVDPVAKRLVLVSGDWDFQSWHIDNSAPVPQLTCRIPWRRSQALPTQKQVFPPLEGFHEKLEQGCRWTCINPRTDSGVREYYNGIAWQHHRDTHVLVKMGWWNRCVLVHPDAVHDPDRWQHYLCLGRAPERNKFNNTACWVSYIPDCVLHAHADGSLRFPRSYFLRATRQRLGLLGSWHGTQSFGRVVGETPADTPSVPAPDCYCPLVAFAC